MDYFRGAFLLVVFPTASWIIYTYFLSPLSSIPNAGFLSPISRLTWEFVTEYKGRITLELPELHKKLGPLVRIGPNQVSFYSLDAYKAIYAPGSAFVKDPRVHNQFVQDGHPALFSITDPKEHAQRRRNMGILFNRSKVPSLSSMMLEEISKLCNMLHRMNREGQIDIIPACRALEADIVSRFAFGTEIGAIDSLQQTGGLLDIVRNNDLKSSKMPTYVSFPRITMFWAYLESITFRLLGIQSSSTASTKRFNKWADEQLRISLDKEQATGFSKSFLNTMIEVGLPVQSALSEAKEMLGPGTDTTSATLAHILWALSLHQSFQAEVVSDLTTAGWPTDMGELEAIPRLTACVKEGIRWTGAAAAMLPRIVPRGGSTVAGKHLPGGVMVCSSPIWYLRDETAFPDPNRYRPSRWLVDKASKSKTLMDEYYIPFSKGPSTCIGIHFSYLELYLSVSQILKNFSLKPADQSLAGIDIEATLPPRLEWVTAVPTVRIAVKLERKRG